MAKPIKETPILKGKDAKKFFRLLEESKSKKANTKDLAKLKANFDRLHSIAQF